MEQIVSLTDPSFMERYSGPAELPGYDRERVTAGIVHLGVGAFHRSHQAVYLDELLQSGACMEWGVCGVGVLPADVTMRDALNRQRCLYTVLSRGSGRLEARVVGSLINYLFSPDDPEAVIQVLASARTVIVSLTVTEGGYYIDATSGEFDQYHPDLQHDLEHPGAPRTHLGLMLEALVRRRAAGVPPFTVLSCDNIQGNGSIARAALVGLATARDGDLGQWIDAEVAFPNSMVDRITPRTTDFDRQEVEEQFGIRDAWPVTCEPFRQWVIEDTFPLGRPKLEAVGVQFVPDVYPYELMKLRLLNASHQTLGYFGFLCGYEYVHEACADPLFRSLLLRYMEREATPTLLPVPGVDLETYRETVVDRFANPAIRDTIARMCLESSTTIPTFVLPVIREQLAMGGEIRHAVAVVASWARYAEGVDEQGNAIDVVDRRAGELMLRARRQRQDATAFIRDNPLFDGLDTDQRFVDAFTRTLRSLHRVGTRCTLKDLVEDRL